MDIGTLTPLLKRLQAAGMVTRTRDVSDDRRVLINLTHASRDVQTEIRSINGRIKAACQLSEAEMRELRSMLDGLAHPATAST